MDDLIDMIARNDSPTDIHSKIKDILYSKSADNIEVIRPAVTASMFGGPNPWLENEVPETSEVEAELEGDEEVEDEEGEDQEDPEYDEEEEN